MVTFNVFSETSRLNAVLIHEPGQEVENMTPATAERALYSDILNLSVASREYQQFKGVLDRVTNVYEIRTIMEEVAMDEGYRSKLIETLTAYTRNPFLADYLQELSPRELCRQIIEGLPHSRLTLTNFLKSERYLVSPLHNFFFMRDSAFTIGNRVVSASMARRVRQLEAHLVRFFLSAYSGFEGGVTQLDDTLRLSSGKFSIEGGDVLVADRDLLLIGTGTRSSTEGIDALLATVLQHMDLSHVIVQELPSEPESFIHLDMVFTLLGHNECMVYKPLILDDSRYHTVLMNIENKSVVGIEYVDNMLEGLKKTGRDYEPVFCGGSNSSVSQEREQWHSGANFLAIDHSKIIGYERNVHTAEALSRKGYEVISARDFISGNKDIDTFKKLLITIEGSELSRGGGGARCMSMPLSRA